MDNDADFHKDGVKRVIEALRDTFGDYFRQYFEDDKPDVMDSDLPCVMVKETNGEVMSGATGTDDIVERIQITVLMNLKDDLGAKEGVDFTGVKLRRLIKGQHPDKQPDGTANPKAKQYHEKTVMYALRQNFTLDDAVVENDVETDIDVQQRGEDFYTKEAIVTLTIKRFAYVPLRN